MNPNGAFLLSDKCPTGHHPGVVAVERNRGEMTLAWPLEYSCGCKKPELSLAPRLKYGTL